MIEVKRVEYASDRPWALCSNGAPLMAFSDEELDQIAQALAFRLEVTDVIAAPTGVAGRVGDNETVHLCYSDNAEDFARAVEAAAGRNGVTM